MILSYTEEAKTNETNGRRDGQRSNVSQDNPDDPSEADHHLKNRSKNDGSLDLY